MAYRQLEAAPAGLERCPRNSFLELFICKVFSGMLLPAIRLSERSLCLLCRSERALFE